MPTCSALRYAHSEGLTSVCYDEAGKFVGLLNELHLESISVLKSFHGISYDSEFSASNFLESLSSVAEEDLNQRLQASPIITVMSDESTDITNTKRLVVYAQIISEDMVPSTLYVTNMECKDATGRGIATALFEELKRRGVPASKVMSTGSDGASAMTGKQNGAAALMQRENPHMVNVHCVAHRLALCTSQAAANIPQLQSHQQVLTDLFYYFKGSAKRQEKLKEVQKILDNPQLIIKEIHSVRWLSYYSALSTVQRILDSLLTYLAEVDGNKDPKAAGLRKKIASETFISITYMMMDAMAPVTILSQFLQTENVDLALVKVKLELCIGDLEKVKTMDSPYLLSLKEDLKPGLFKGHVISNTNLNLRALTERFIDAMKDNIASRYILTCGSDGDVRIWEGAEDDDAVSHRTGDRAFCVLFKNEKFYVATDTNTVQAFTFPDGSVDGIMARFTAPVNHMCLDESGNTLVAGSSDFSVKSVNLTTSDVTKFEGHEAPILGVALDPKKEYLASSSCDGSVKIWKMENQECVKSIQGLPKVSDTSLAKGWCRLCWEKNHGKHLYIPMEKEIQIYDRDTWSKSGVLQDDEYTGIYSVLEMSPNGNFIAAGCYDGHVLIFNLKNGACTDRFKHENGLSIMSMAWNPKNQEEIAFCDREGQLGLLSNIKLDGQSKTGTEVRVKETMGIFDDDDDTDLVLAGGDEPPEGNEDSNDSVPSNNVLKTFEDDAESVDLDVPPIVPPVIQREGYKPTPPQPAFQPGSSPVHLSSRYMMWNAVGIVKQFNTDEEESIDIEFHNTSVHHAMHLTNSAGYTMADISTEAVVLASPSDPENPSKLTCMHFGSWDNSKEWTIPMPEEEDIEAVALGEDWIAVATSCRVVRIFSLGGIQKEIFSIPGPVVCLCAHTNQLMITYHRGMGLPGDQCLGVHLLIVEGETQIDHQPLPLSSKTTLSWMGFSAEGTPFYMDSRGILRMCNRKFGKNWMQVADTKSHTKGKSDHFWIVSVHENPQQLRCIPCKGSRYPATLPRPAVGVLPFQMPLCQMNTEKSQYEEVFLRTQLFGNHLDHWSEIGYEFDPSLPSELFKPAQESLMKLFALSARCEREFRALEVCEIMKDPHTLQLAIKYACRMKYLQLAERISEVAQRKSNEEEERMLSQQQEESQYTQSYNGQEDDEDMEEDQENVETPTATGPLLNLKPKQKTEVMSQSFGSSGRSNPFKVITSQKADSTKGTQVFDHMSKKKQTSPAQVTIKNTRPIKTKKTTQGQVKLPVKQKNEEVINGHDDKNVNRGKSAFDLWFEEAKPELQEEFPDTEDDVLTQTAAERFRQIPKADRQIWTQKAKQLKENTESKKRKREDENDECQTKKTNPKLAAFSFTKA